MFVYIHSQTHTQYLHRFIDRYYHIHNCKKEGRREGREGETERVIKVSFGGARRGGGERGKERIE